MPGSSGEDESHADVVAATAADLSEVEAMAAACGGGPSWPAEAWGNFVQPSSGEGFSSVLLLLRGSDRELCGWLAASRVWERSELEFVLVAPACRGRGVASSLVDSWLQWARRQGAATAELEVRASNQLAQRLYRAKGFTEQGRRPGYYARPVEDALLMGRML